MRDNRRSLSQTSKCLAESSLTAEKDAPDFALEVQIAYLRDFESLAEASDSNPRTYGSSYKSITRPAFISSSASSRRLSSFPDFISASSC